VKLACCILQEAIGGSDPERTEGVLCEAGDVVTGEGGVALVMEDFEIGAVEAGYATFGRNPDIAVPGLEDLMDAALWKAVLGGPELVSQVGGTLRICSCSEGCDPA
jgi:hypothetical protein